MNELILKFNELDDFGKRELLEYINRLLKKHRRQKKADTPKEIFDYNRFQFPISQLKFDRDEMNSRD